MRKKSAGLLSLVVAAGLGTTLGVPAATATAATTGAQGVGGTAAPARPRRQGDELPNPLEEKSRALREEALTELLNGKGKVEKRGASTVMKVSAPPDRRSRSTPRAHHAARRDQDQYVELSREKTDKIFVVLAEFGNKRDPRYPDKDIEPATPGPGDVRRARCTTRSRRPTAPRTTPPSGSRTTTARTSRTSTSAAATPPAPAATPSRSGSTSSGSPPAATASTARSPTG